jgi:hypothetical protein
MICQLDTPTQDMDSYTKCNTKCFMLLCSLLEIHSHTYVRKYMMDDTYLDDLIAMIAQRPLIVYFITLKIKKGFYILDFFTLFARIFENNF